jgi:putative Holliday junction resolvase
MLIGKPLNMDGTDSDIMKLVEKFHKKLYKLTGIECKYIDERLTSFEARQNFKELMTENNTSIKSEAIDAHAAKILIDNWLNQNVDTI